MVNGSNLQSSLLTECLSDDNIHKLFVKNSQSEILVDKMRSNKSTNLEWITILKPIGFDDAITMHIRKGKSKLVALKMRIIILALVLGLTVCYPANSAVGRYGKLRVDGLHLVSQSGQRVQLRGVSTHGPQWYYF